MSADAGPPILKDGSTAFTARVDALKSVRYGCGKGIPIHLPSFQTSKSHFWTSAFPYLCIVVVIRNCARQHKGDGLLPTRRGPLYTCYEGCVQPSRVAKFTKCRWNGAVPLNCMLYQRVDQVVPTCACARAHVYTPRYFCFIARDNRQW